MTSEEERRFVRDTPGYRGLVRNVEHASSAMGMSWGDKGCEYRPDKCQHPPEDGCEWCCMRCNTDTHLCPGCGTVVGHLEIACEECQKL